MKKAMMSLATAAILGAGAVAEAEEAALLQPGEYLVTIRLELPHIEDVAGTTKVGSTCVTVVDAETRGLVVLSELNPLRQCPASNVLQDGDTLTFDIVCPGTDAAVGSARYIMWAERFDGAITVRMGGKNMTMIERQSGRRAGNCK
jgi:uncharacterized protein DUF3617